MNTKKVIYLILAAAMTAVLSGAVGYPVMTGDGVKKISVENNDIRQITCKGEYLNTSIIGSDKINSIEMYMSQKPMTEEQLKNADLVQSDEVLEENMLKTDKKELQIVLKKKNKDGRYLTLFTPKNMSIIVTQENGDLKVNNISGELLLDGKSMDTAINNVSGVINYRNKSGDLSVEEFEGVMDIKTFSGDIDLKEITGSLSVENTSGDFDLTKFDGKLTSTFQVGDINISSSKITEAKIQNQSGDVVISDVKGDKLSMESSLGDIRIKNSELDVIKIDLSAGELKLSDVTGDVDLEMNLGDIVLDDFTLPGKIDSSIEVNFGEISLGFKDPASYNFLKSVKDEKVGYKPGMNIDDDIKICTKNDKCLRIDTNMGSIKVK